MGLRGCWAALAVLWAAKGALAVLVEVMDGELLWTKTPGHTGPLSPLSSFAFYDALSPNLTMFSDRAGAAPVRFPRGRADPMRSYIGMKMWSSRGDFDHRRAILAMLGDQYAYYESPMFTAYKLLALSSIHELPDKIFDSTGDNGFNDYERPHGYSEYWAEITSRAYDVDYMRQFPKAATEPEAVLFAKALIDDLFHHPTDAAEWGDKFLDGWVAEDAYYLLFSSLSYRKAAKLYGTDSKGTAVLVLGPGARDRAMDAGYYKLLKETGRANMPRLTQDSFATAVSSIFPEMCRCTDDDFTELMTPGYIQPQHVLGMELDGRSFYRLEKSGTVFVVILESKDRCVTQQEEHGRFFFCEELECPEDPDSCGPPPLVPTTPPEQILVSGVIYAFPSGQVEAVAARMAEEAHSLLASLNQGIHRPAKDSPSPLATPIEFLSTLQDMQFAAGGMNVAAVLLGEGGERVGVSLNTAGRPRPSAAEVLKARRAAKRTKSFNLGPHL